MTGDMNYFHSCPCASDGDLLDCAPCPPPFLPYMQLKLAAVGKLCQKEVCSIARRCKVSESPALTKDCPVPKPAVFKCDLFCIITIVSVLAFAVIIM